VGVILLLTPGPVGTAIALVLQMIQ